MTKLGCPQYIAHTSYSVVGNRAGYSALLSIGCGEGSMLGRAFTVAVVLFSLGIAILIGVRMDQASVSIISGFIIGAAIGAPIVSIITWLVVRQRQADATVFSSRTSQPSMPSTPPQVVYLPAPAPYQPMPSGTHRPAPWSTEPFVMSKQRRFYLIGDDGLVSEIKPDADPAST